MYDIEMCTQMHVLSRYLQYKRCMHILLSVPDLNFKGPGAENILGHLTGPK